VAATRAAPAGWITSTTPNAVDSVRPPPGDAPRGETRVVASRSDIASTLGTSPPVTTEARAKGSRASCGAVAAPVAPATSRRSARIAGPVAAPRTGRGATRSAGPSAVAGWTDPLSARSVVNSIPEGALAVRTVDVLGARPVAAQSDAVTPRCGTDFNVASLASAACSAASTLGPGADTGASGTTGARRRGGS
jgi:hypothetical protein